MHTTAHIAKHLRDLYFGKNWTWSTYRDHLSDMTWEQANAQIGDLNTIVTLLYHTNYYMKVQADILQGKPLQASDKESFIHPPVTCAADWTALLEQTWAYAEALAVLIEQFPEEQLDDIFVEDKYGTYYRNFHGVIEHAHYHLGQIVLIKKMLKPAL